ncbi:hypothetical protein [Streptomyces sp. NPDC001985]|uniref:hypothetical protein n=1 Tax=Streptomyces sp. NPDC001985 TaxID=3154406 RepID=UPI00331A4CDD
MIRNTISFNSTNVTDRSVVASACVLGFTVSLHGTRVSGAPAAMPQLPLGGLSARTGNERPTKALEAGVAAAEAKAYAFAAASAEEAKQIQHHTTKKWAFRGLEPWSDPA